LAASNSFYQLSIKINLKEDFPIGVANNHLPTGPILNFANRQSTFHFEDLCPSARPRCHDARQLDTGRVGERAFSIVKRKK
jgi:hypothetical protein